MTWWRWWRCGAAVGMVMMALAVGGDEVMAVFGVGRGVVVTCRWWWCGVDIGGRVTAVASVVDGHGGEVVMMAVVVLGWRWREWWRRVMESGVVDLIDRETRNVFEVRRKRSPKKFSGGSGGGGGGLLVAGNNGGIVLPGDDANKHLDKFLHVTQSIKVNGVTDDALRLYLFPHSLTHRATAWFDRLLRNSITTFEQMAKMFLGKYFPPFMVTKLRNEITNFRQHSDESLFEAWEHYKLSIDRCPNHNMLPITQIDTFYNGLTLRHRDTINVAAGETFMKTRPEERYDLIENMTAYDNDWDTFAQRSESSSSITSSSDPKIVSLKAEMAKINKNLMKVLQINQQVKAVTHSCETWGGPHSYNDCPATVGQTQNVYVAGAYNQGVILTNLNETEFA
uniref:Reverse transcriptase domain-containing protein n=1 Tax=Tanacetum cinerariifolium TaxID=118510 RepID=A0A6L2KJ35_TANCI|nr:reverse transcriptase domain-containing protein [Tanacetum cinerariifolium]